LIASVGPIDQHAVAFSKDRGIRGIPRHPERFRDPSHGQLLTHDPSQRPSQRATGQAGAGRGGPVSVLPPHALTAGALVAADLDAQQHRSPPERFVREVPGDGIPGTSLAAALLAPGVSINDFAVQHGLLRGEVLPGHGESEFVQSTKSRHVRAGTGSVGHVKVFRVGGVGTPIIERS